jgi:hypothetical protein
MSSSSASGASRRRRHPGTAVAVSLSVLLLAACGAGPDGAVEGGAPDVQAPVADASPDGLPDAGPDLAPPIDNALPDHDPLLGFPPEGNQRLRGFIVFGNELHAFQSCGLPALTWVDLQGGERGWDKLEALIEPCGPDAGAACALRFFYVELDAVVSGPCRCGHLGKYERTLRVEELLNASANPPPDCPRTTPHFP